MTICVKCKVRRCLNFDNNVGDGKHCGTRARRVSGDYAMRVPDHMTCVIFTFSEIFQNFSPIVRVSTLNLETS